MIKYLAGNLDPETQDDSSATYAPMIKKAESELNFNHSAASLERRIRAFNPWPCAYTEWQGNRLKIHQSHTAKSFILEPGKTTIHEGLPAISTSDGLLVLDEVQPAGKKAMSAEVFLRGARDWGQD